MQRLGKPDEKYQLFRAGAKQILNLATEDDCREGFGDHFRSGLQYFTKKTMRIEHLAMWTRDLERLKLFYINYFDAKASDRYHNPAKQFSSYFLSFDKGCRLELMELPVIMERETDMHQYTGLAHFAVSTGSSEKVDVMTHTLRLAGYVVAGEPRWTGDGYYESIVLDPDGNKVEITV